MPLIYHVTTIEDWNAAKQVGYYEHSSLKDEGFIHCSHEHQLAGVLERYFAGKTGLVRLVIDTEKLSSKFVFDWSPSLADTFPHVYGPIHVDAVLKTEDVL